MNWLFQSFLEDPSVYRQAQQYWEQLYRSSLPRIYPDEQLRINKFNNPDNDGNPIFTGICRPLQLAVRVIQQPVGEPDDLDLDCWIDSVALDPGSSETRELVISCCPSRENEHEIMRLLRDWFTKGQVAPVEYRDEDRPWEGSTFSFSPELCLR